MRVLSRNARLYLMATTLQGVGSGIWNVIFNLYLRQVGFHPDLIGNVFTAGAIATGLIALPAGLLCERIGPRRALFVGLTANLVNCLQILVVQPSALLLVSLSSGLIGTVYWVAGAPFMVENSRVEERTYLFSVNWALLIVMQVAGSYLGGVMPGLFNSYLNLSVGTPDSVVGYRLTLATSLVLALLAAIPLFLVRENHVNRTHRMVDLLSLRNVRSPRVIIRFMIPTAIIGFGAGFVVPLFNIFFASKFAATDEQIGIMSALSNVTLGVGTLGAPALAKRLGKARSVALCEYLSMPFIMLTTLAPTLPLAGFTYVSRNALMNMAGPIGTALQMELVTENERATTNGLMVMADNIPRAVTASVSGRMMTGNDFLSPFLFTTVTYFVASSIYFYFFRNAEAQAAKVKSEQAS